MQKSTGLDTYRRLLTVSKRYWLIFFIGIIATVLLSMSDAGFTWLIKPIVNKGFINRDNFFIKVLPIIVVLIFILRAFSSFGSSYFLARVARNVVMDIRKMMFRQLLKLPAGFYDSHSSGKLLSTMLYNVEQVSQASSDVLATFLREGSLALGLLTVMFVINWRLSLIFLLIVPAIGWGIKLCSTRLRKLSTGVQDSVATVSHIANESIEAYQVVRLYGGQDYETKKFDQAVQKNRHQELKVQVTNGLGTAAIQILLSLPLAVMLYAATSPQLGVTAGSFAAIISAMIMLVRPMRRVTNLNNFIQKGVAAAESIFALLDEAKEMDRGQHQSAKVEGNIVFSAVGFQYKNDSLPVLKNISFSLQAGKTIALVGSSGSGKSTLVSLLPRFYDHYSGSITIDGVELHEYKLQELRQQFAFVSQHPVLFNDTVSRNIAYAQDSIDTARLHQAAKLADAYEFIQALPQGFDTLVGENGLLLSGGQRQRLAIARALYKAAPILILDEATSALDTQAEHRIQVALQNLMNHCTTLVIAHRLSTIENADTILVMDNGVIVEQGKHAELLQYGGRYAELHRLQFRETEVAG